MHFKQSATLFSFPSLFEDVYANIQYMCIHILVCLRFSKKWLQLKSFKTSKLRLQNQTLEQHWHGS